MGIPKLFTKKETANILRVSERTIEIYVLDGKTNRLKTGHIRLFTEEHINEFIKSGET